MGDKSFRIKAITLILIFASLWLCSAGRLFYLQIMKSREISKRMREEQLRHLLTEAKRGDILDRKGRVLATDLKMYTLYAKKDLIEDPQKTADALSNYGIGSKSRLESLLKDDAEFIKIARGVPDSIVEEIELKGIYAVREWYRYYPSRKIGKTTIGTLNWKREGIIGIEREYNDLLMGIDGWAYYLEVPRYSGIKLLKKSEADYKDPIPGKDIYLTIDLDLQTIMDNELRELKESTQADQVMGICVSVHTGEILSMVSIPEFEPQEGWSNNGCTSWEFEPGSIFKLIPAFAYLRNGLSPGDIVVDSTSSTSFGGKVFRDLHSHPAYTFREAIIHSSNAGFISVGEMVGKKEMYRCARLLGIGCKTGIDLPIEYSGKIPVLPRERDIRLATVSFGQGVSVTPLQMVMAYQAIANDGVLLRPRVMKEVRRNHKVIRKSGKEVIRRLGDPGISMTLLDVLHDAALKGTGLTASLSLLPIAGKTGTAWRVKNGRYVKEEYISSFVGMFPYPKPEFVIGIFIDNPKGAYYASLTACPAFREVAKRMALLKGFRKNLL
ncbi:MAG: penicillin-binding protein 2 [candidate division WOR-3 bacterium]|nr:penicillin-binding protein 2 [candidate division WOR-3 bacterium]